MNKISCVIITYNEEDVIKKCLNSIKWVDEIIICDLGSRDKTLSICKSFTKNIFHIKYVQYVEKARNIAISKAKNNWILIIDPDEFLPKNAKKILKKITYTNKYDAFMFPRRNYITPKLYLKHGYFYPDYQIRLFQKTKDAKYYNIIHEQPKISQKKIKIIKDTYFCHNHLKSKYKSFFHFPLFFRYISIEGKMLSKTKKTAKQLIFDIIYEFLKHFYRSFFKLYGYKDGFYGFRASFLYSMYKSAISLYALFLRIKKQP